MKKFTGILVAVGLVAGLGGCDKASKLAQNLQDSAKESLQKAQDEVVAANGGNSGEALEAYVDAENDIISMGSSRGGLEGVLERYKKQKLSEATAKKRSPETGFRASSLSSVVEDLKKATAVELKGDYAPLNSVGKALYDAAVPFEKTVKELDEYFTTKAYMEDDFAKGKELDPVLIKQAEAFITAYNAFAVESSKVEVIRNDNLVKNLKANGKLAQAYGYEAYGYMMKFLNVASAEDVKDDAVKAKLDALIVSTDKALKEMKAAVEKPQEDLSSRVESAMKEEFELLGKMREAKSKGYNNSSLGSFAKEYNDFVSYKLNLGFLK